MVERQIRARGVARSARARRDRERSRARRSCPPELAEFAYDDRPLPIEAGQTISQPYIVALMTEALELEPDERVLEIGTGSGYAAAVLARIATQVYTIERHAELADARARAARAARLRERRGALRRRHARLARARAVRRDRRRGRRARRAARAARPARDRRPARDARSGPRRAQELVRVTRVGETEYRREDLGAVRFVPLIGAQGWAEPPRSRRAGVRRAAPGRCRAAPASRPELVAKLIARVRRADRADRRRAARRAARAHRRRARRAARRGDARHLGVLPDARAHHAGADPAPRLPRRRGRGRLARRRGGRSLRARHSRRGRAPWTPFARFPTWMWRNRETQRAGRVAARVQRASAGRATSASPASTSTACTRRRTRSCATSTASIRRAAQARARALRLPHAVAGRSGGVRPRRARRPHAVVRGGRGRDAARPAREAPRVRGARRRRVLRRRAERARRRRRRALLPRHVLRRAPSRGTCATSTCSTRSRSILAHRGADAKVVVWEHNSHVGDAAATEMAARGEHNVGQLCRGAFGDDVFIVGFGTDHGTVAAAHDWDEPMERMRVRPAHADSYERLCHDAGVPAFLLHLREPARDALRDELAEPRLERAIGVVYRPETELAEPLLPGRPAGAVRRVRLVRRDRGGRRRCRPPTPRPCPRRIRSRPEGRRGAAVSASRWRAAGPRPRGRGRPAAGARR